MEQTSLSGRSAGADPRFELPKQYVTFRVGNLCFGVDVAQAKEIIKYQAMTPVPLAPPFVRGLINLRGQIITAIDLRALLEMEPASSDMRPMNVVIQIGAEVISLLVDRVGDVIDIEPAWFEPTPETIAPQIGSLITGIFKLKKELVLIFDGLACIERGSSKDN